MTNKVVHNSKCTMAFGRPSKHADCPRCEELKAGAEPRSGWSDAKREFERRSIEAIRAHDCKRAGCGPVCTFGDW